ncbi:unnamed protein product [Caenorhabditis sp. 36 PRJEB53466]|nr:unnamed protein product [Caenorhabditis sp. 36 PRJEB53466]
MLRSLLLLAFISSVSMYSLAKADEPNVLCNGCQFAVNLVETQLKKIETGAKKDLTIFADKACAKAPKLEVFDTVCSKIKDDLIDIAVQLIESLERQVSGNVTCKALKFCT